MTTYGMGHNKGPSLEPGSGWRRYAWKRARAGLLKNKVPMEIVRIRVRRARELGLSYPQYASILMGSGRDIVGFLFTVDGLQLRLRRQLELPSDVQRKLQDLTNCKIAAFSPPGESAEMFRKELEAVSGVAIASSTPEPQPPARWSAARAAVRASLDPLGLPGGAILMIGSRELEREWATAARLASFLQSSEYFQPNA